MSAHAEPAVAAQPGNPWPGLASYTEQDRERFFGRELETAELVRYVERDLLTILFGRSGLGKTSLLRAGLVPELEEGGYLAVFIRIDHSGQAPHPIEQAKAFARRVFETERVEVEWLTQLAGDATLWEFFHALEIWGSRNDLRKLLLVFDQFEEAFTIGRTSARTREFLEQLADLAEDRVPASVRARVEESATRLTIGGGATQYKVLISLREDYVSHLDGLQPLMPAILRNRFSLRALEPEAAVSVVLRAGGSWVTQEVARAIVRAVQGAQLQGTPGGSAVEPGTEIEPAYLSVMCHELFERMNAAGSSAITLDLVAQEHGRILDALYERSFVGLDPRTRLFVEEHLVTPTGFRTTLPVADAVQLGVSTAELDTLVDRRLLRFEDRFGTQHAELSHDLLTRIVRNSREARHARESQELKSKQSRQQARRLRRSRILAGLATSLLVAIGLGWAYHYVMSVQPTQTVYASIVSSFGAPQGIAAPLDPTAVAHRTLSWRITRQGRRGPVLTLEAIDSQGKPQLVERQTYVGTDERSNERAKACRWEYSYDSDGHVVKEAGFDKRGREVSGLVYLTEEPGPNGHPLRAMVTYVGPGGYPQPPSRSRAEYIEITYDPATGFERQQRFLDADGNSVPGKDSAFGKRIVYDAAGRTLRNESLDRDGHPMVDEDGNAILTVKYDLDAAGRIVGERYGYLDEAGAPIALLGCAEVTRKYDTWGNETSRSCIGLDHKPAVRRDWVATTELFEYDAAGNLTAERHRAADGKPAPAGTWPYCSEVQLTYDPASNQLLGKTYYDRPNHVMAGCSSVRFRYDALGFQNDERWFDTEGKPCNPRGGAHEERRTNDALGQLTKTVIYSADGKPKRSSDSGCPATTYRYDERGNIVTESYWTESDAPCVNPKTLVHEIRHSYDRFGEATSDEYWGIQGRVRALDLGFHRKEKQHNAFGKTEERYFDEYLRPVNGLGGYHRKAYLYNHVGLQTVEANYDTENARVDDTDGIWRDIAEYDSHRKYTHGYRFNAKQERIVDIEFKHDALGLTSDVRLTYVGRPGDNWGKHHEYDARGRETLVQYLDDKQQETSRVRTTYDDQGNIAEETWLGTNGVPIDQSGISSVRHEYDEFDHESRVEYFNAAGKPADFGGTQQWLRAYDESGLVLRETKLNAQGGAAWDAALGVATHVVDVSYPDGRESSEAFLTAAGQPVVGSPGFARQVERSYPDGGKETSLFGVTGELFSGPVLGYARAVTLHPDKEHWVEKFFDDRGQLVAPLGFAERRYQTDELGRITREEYFDENGKPTYGLKGYHREEHTYMEPGPDVVNRSFDVDGKPIATSGSVEMVYLQVISQRSKAVGIGLRTGDIVRRFGSWSFDESNQRAARTNVTPQVTQEFIDMIVRSRTQALPLTVVRNGQTSVIQVGPLGQNGLLGVSVKTRTLPRKAYEAFAKRFP